MRRVEVRQLERFSEKPLPVEGGRFWSPAGELAQVVNGDVAFRFMACVEILAGQRRGNHFHESKTETLYVILGELTARFEDLDTGERLRVELTAGSLVRVEPRCAHVYEASEDSRLVEVSEFPFDPADTYVHELQP